MAIRAAVLGAGVAVLTVALVGCSTTGGTSGFERDGSQMVRTGIQGQPPTDYRDALYTKTRPMNASVVYESEAGPTYKRSSRFVRRAYDDPEVSPERRSVGKTYVGVDGE